MSIRIERSSDHGADRYKYDQQLTGHAQLDTNQDASYFGTWINPNERKIVCYCEGDVTVTTCDTDAELVSEVERMREFYGDGFRGIDPGWPGTAKCEAIRDGLKRVGLGQYIH